LNPKFAIAFARTVCANFGFGALVDGRIDLARLVNLASGR
jgi:hypothetical protein